MAGNNALGFPFTVAAHDVSPLRKGIWGLILLNTHSDPSRHCYLYFDR